MKNCEKNQVNWEKTVYILITLVLKTVCQQIKSSRKIIILPSNSTEKIDAEKKNIYCRSIFKVFMTF